MEKWKQEQLLNDSESFMADYFASLHYDVSQRLDNCTWYYLNTASHQYTDYHKMSGSACPSSEYNTPYCQCVRMIRYPSHLYQQLSIIFVGVCMKMRWRRTCSSWQAFWWF